VRSQVSNPCICKKRQVESSLTRKTNARRFLWVKFLTAFQCKNSSLRNIARSFAYNGHTLGLIRIAGWDASSQFKFVPFCSSSQNKRSSDLAARITWITCILPPHPLHCIVPSETKRHPSLAPMPLNFSCSINPSDGVTSAPERVWESDFAKYCERRNVTAENDHKTQATHVERNNVTRSCNSVTTERHPCVLYVSLNYISLSTMYKYWLLRNMLFFSGQFTPPTTIKRT
jgi:hypothetical protein